MSVVEEAIHTILTSESAITNIVATRVYPVVIPQGGTIPAVTYQRISTPRIWDLDGPDGMATPRMQLNCWGTSYSSASSLSNAVRGVLDNYSGTADSVVIHQVALEDEGDLFEPQIGIDTARRYGRRMDFIVWHGE